MRNRLPAVLPLAAVILVLALPISAVVHAQTGVLIPSTAPSDSAYQSSGAPAPIAISSTGTPATTTSSTMTSTTDTSASLPAGITMPSPYVPASQIATLLSQEQNTVATLNNALTTFQQSGPPNNWTQAQYNSYYSIPIGICNSLATSYYRINILNATPPLLIANAPAFYQYQVNSCAYNSPRGATNATTNGCCCNAGCMGDILGQNVPAGSTPPYQY